MGSEMCIRDRARAVKVSAPRLQPPVVVIRTTKEVPGKLPRKFDKEVEAAEAKIDAEKEDQEDEYTVRRSHEPSPRATFLRVCVSACLHACMRGCMHAYSVARTRTKPESAWCSLGNVPAFVTRSSACTYLVCSRVPPALPLPPVSCLAFATLAALPSSRTFTTA